MKFKLTVFLSLFIINYATAQKVDLDRTYVSYAYTSLPTKPLPVEYKTYNATAVITSSSSNLSSAEVEDAINLAGFEKVSKSTKADLSVAVKFGDFMIDAAEVKERVDVTKDKAGKETGRKYYYWVEVSYSFSGSLRLVNNVLGQDMVNNILQNTSSKLLFKSAEYGTRGDAAGYWNNNKETLKSKFLTEAIKGKIDYANNTLSATYGYRTLKKNYLLWFQGEKKHTEFELNNKMVEQFKIVSASVKANQPLTPELVKSFKPMIDYFIDVKARFNKDDKNDKKMRYSAFYNLSTIYIMLEDYANARKEAEGLYNNDYDKNDSKDLIREIEYAEEQLKINNTSTRHFINKRIPAETI